MKKNMRDKRTIMRKRMEKALASRPHLRPYCNQDRQARILIWDTEEQRVLEEHSCPKRKKLAKYLSKYPSCEIYYGQDQERVALWDMKRQKKIPGPRKSELVAYLIANPTHEIYQRQEKRARVFLWNPVGSGDKIMVESSKVKEYLQANLSWDHYYNQDGLNKVPIWDPVKNTRVRYDALPHLANLHLFLRFHQEVEIYNQQDKEELDRKEQEKEERERKAREAEAKRKAERAAEKEKVKAYDEETKQNPLIRMWNCKEWCEVGLGACPRWSNLIEYLIGLPDHFPYESQDDPEFDVPLYNRVKEIKEDETVKKRDMDDFLHDNSDLEPYCNQDGKESVRLYDTRNYHKIKQKGPTRSELRKCLSVNKHCGILINEVAFVHITDAELKEQEEAARKQEEVAMLARENEEKKAAQDAEFQAQGIPEGDEQGTLNAESSGAEKEEKGARAPPKRKWRKKKPPARRRRDPFKSYLYLEDVLESKELDKLNTYKALNHGHGVTMTLFSAKDFRNYMVWKDARTKREEAEKQAKQKAKERKTNTSALTGFSVMD